MGVTIGVLSIKGGVGKTTIASSLATDLATRYGKKVLLVDGNFSAPNLGLHMDIVTPDTTIHEVLAGKSRLASSIHSRYGVDVIPGSYFSRYLINPLKLKDKLSLLSKEYDYTVLDSSPALNDETLATMLAAEQLFVVTTPDYPTLSCSLRAARLAQQRGRPIAGIIVNKIRDPRYELDLKEIEEALELPVVARLPDEKKAVRALFTRIPLSLYAPRSSFSIELGKLSGVLANKKEKLGAWRQLFRLGYKREQVNRQLLKQQLYRSAFRG
ncbi:MAG TPA: MinD/ParA family protein [Candidatus Nanoarchaeia archaeon]|nr:MinD/ParA family protein [Candidatus Nanoarchaeia archaeon]